MQIIMAEKFHLRPCKCINLSWAQNILCTCQDTFVAKEDWFVCSFGLVRGSASFHIMHSEQLQFLPLSSFFLWWFCVMHLKTGQSNGKSFCLWGVSAKKYQREAWCWSCCSNFGKCFSSILVLFPPWHIRLHFLVYKVCNLIADNWSLDNSLDEGVAHVWQYLIISESIQDIAVDRMT